MIYAFGDCILDEGRHELCRAGQVVEIEPKVFQVLLYLLQHRDRVVTKDDLSAHCWPETFVSEAALTRCLAKVRQAVQPGRNGTPVIKTIHRQGYRFVAAVTLSPAGLAPATVAMSSAASSPERLEPNTPERIYQLRHSGLPREFPPLQTLESRPHNLPVQATALIGRRQEIEVIQQRLLHPDSRLMTLTGPGGIGKTRLGLQVAAACIEHFADGVFCVGLASLADAALVIPSMARTLGLREAADRSPLEALADLLRDKQLLC